MADPDEPTPIRVVVIETPITGVLLGPPPQLLPEPADPTIGWTTHEDGDW